MNLQTKPTPGNWTRGEDIQFERSKLHFHIMQISDHRYLEESLQEPAEKVESRIRRTSNWYRSVEDQRIGLAAIHLWTKLR